MGNRIAEGKDVLRTQKSQVKFGCGMDWLFDLG